ncbi:hypothetical protein DUNSADRAFT_11283 [Dunaliella salina]|uniref:Encoded protein n=1 Tax=Dunaliella salina TaxID=3046 RepID=A0ABQ7GDQ8_DUNSA|nr:hypothetical protein DUNSADRAFT_11283 [Dunaliella salina]|eukprot:KAF5832733.1 hypothetical protein DUNSADRAFT_11283 [Dunaliella salina]
MVLWVWLHHTRGHKRLEERKGPSADACDCYTIPLCVMLTSSGLQVGWSLVDGQVYGTASEFLLQTSAARTCKPASNWFPCGWAALDGLSAAVCLHASVRS